MRTEEGSTRNKKRKKEARARNRHLPKEGLKKLRQMEKKIEKKIIHILGFRFAHKTPVKDTQRRV
jgi:hypothetical protein